MCVPCVPHTNDSTHFEIIYAENFLHVVQQSSLKRFTQLYGALWLASCKILDSWTNPVQAHVCFPMFSGRSLCHELG